MANGDATQGQLDRFAFNAAVADARARRAMGLVPGHPLSDTEDFPLVTTAAVDRVLNPEAAAAADTVCAQSAC